MKDGRPSITAKFVATWRGLAPCFGPGMQLCEDPYGIEFGIRPARAMANLAHRHPKAAQALFRSKPVFGLAGWLQLRTRIIDDNLIEFIKAGGKQIVILGAGFDARAYRLNDQLNGSVVFEVDHPATQSCKLGRLKKAGADVSRVKFLPWHFEEKPLAELPAALAGAGHDPVLPTLTIWEGVSMYLTEKANSDAVRAIRSFSGPDSRLVMNYNHIKRITHPPIGIRFTTVLGEPMRFGWEPSTLPAWMSERGFSVMRNLSDRDLAGIYFPPDLAKAFPDRGGNIAVCAPSA